MSNIWSYRDDLSTLDRDLIGYSVEASDGHIGKVDKSSRDTDRSHLVVDTGFWIFGKKRTIPAGVVSRVDTANNTVYINMTKDQVKDAPDWRDDWDTDDGARMPYSEYFGPYSW